MKEGAELNVIDYEALYTEAWGHMTIKICNLSWVELLNPPHLDFELELEGLEDQGGLNGWKTYMKSYLACNG